MGDVRIRKTAKKFHRWIKRRNRRYAQSILILFISAILPLVAVMRGTSHSSTAVELDGANLVSFVNATNLGPQLWSDNFSNAAIWQVIPKVPTVSGTKAYILINDSTLNFTVFFAASSTPQALSLSRGAIRVSLDANPVAISRVAVSREIHYGIRFSGQRPGNTPFEMWSEGSPLQHRLGQGVTETLITNLPLEAYFSSGNSPPLNSTLASIDIYLEAVPGQTGWFSVLLSSLAIFPMEQRAYSDNNIERNGILIGLSPRFRDIQPRNSSLFEAFVGFRIEGTKDLQYRLYLNQGISQLAEGYIYHQKSILDYEESVLSPGIIRDYPIVYSSSNVTYVSVVALQGSITYFHLDTLIFHYLSQTPTLSGNIDQGLANLTFVYYMTFLFLMPVAIIGLLARALKNEEHHN